MSKREPPRMSDAEIRDLAIGLHREQVFTDRHINETDTTLLGSIFMPIGLGAFADVDMPKIGAVYEWLHKAGPRSVNGYPMFMSVKMVHVDDWPKVAKLYEELTEAVEGV